MYVTLEPCAHHGSTPPCTEAILAAGVERVVFGHTIRTRRRPAARSGCARRASTSSSSTRGRRARPERGVAHLGAGAAPVRDLQGGRDPRRPGRRPGARWVTGEESRRLVHELRAQVDAVAVGRRHRAGRPAEPRRPRRRDAEGPAAATCLLAAGRCRRASTWSCGAGPLAEELAALAADGVQSLLLEGGPTLASAFLAADLVDKLLLFVAPVLAGDGPSPTASLPSPRTLTHLTATPVGADVLLEAYVHDP